MKKLFRNLSLFGALLLVAPQVHALALDINPWPPKISPGDPLQVTIGISGLHSPQSANARVDSLLAAYSFDLNYDPYVLSYSLPGSHAYSYIGAPGSEVLFSIDYASDPGVIHFAATSLLTDLADLVAAQSDAGQLLDAFPLVDFRFIGLPVMPHTSQLWVSNAILGDFDGNPVALRDMSGNLMLDADGVPLAAPVDLPPASFKIPVPATLSLLLPGLSMIYRRRRVAVA